jgi:anaerobic magnesium-protoporphyrin IX monomethyl ester cyclase
MDILLINSPINSAPMAKGTTIPLGLSYLASYLKIKGFEIGCLDMAYEEYDDTKFKAYLLKYRPKIVGISFTTHSRFQTLKKVKIVRETLPDAHITLGGHHVTGAPLDTLRNVDVDSIVFGDGEEPLYRLCCDILEAKIKIDRDGTAGLVYASRININRNNFKKAVLDNLDLYPWPDRDIFETKKYNLFFPANVTVKASKIEYLLTSRGCPYACKFCSAYLTHGKESIRFRNIVNVVDEIEYLIKVRNCDGLYIYDDNFTWNIKRIKDFALEMKRRNIFIPFVCYGRVDTVSYHAFKLLRDVGLQSISFGIESGSQKILRYLNKNTTNEQAIKVVKICEDLGIVAKGTFILGSPKETITDFLQTLKLIYKLKKIHPNFIANIGLSGLFIYPGTGVFYDAMNAGILPKDFSWFCEYPEIKQNIDVPIYFDIEIEKLMFLAPKLVKIFEARYLLLHNPQKLWRALKNKTFYISKSFLRN